MIVSPSDFSTLRLWEEVLVLSRFHLYIVIMSGRVEFLSPELVLKKLADQDLHCSLCKYMLKSES